MYLLDTAQDRSISNVLFLLTRPEALSIRSKLEEFLRPKDTGSGRELRIPSEDHKKEITIVLYDPKNLEGLTERHRKLVQKDT